MIASHFFIRRLPVRKKNFKKNFMGQLAGRPERAKECPGAGSGWGCIRDPKKPCWNTKKGRFKEVNNRIYALIFLYMFDFE